MSKESKDEGEIAQFNQPKEELEGDANSRKGSSGEVPETETEAMLSEASSAPAWSATAEKVAAIMAPTVDCPDGYDEFDGKSLASNYSYYMPKNFRYYFQHPYSRLIVAYLVTLCNFFIFAEDPVAHSRSECNIPVIGNCYGFVVDYYPPNGWSALKVFLWLLAILLGMIAGKLLVHRLLFGRLLRLKMFEGDQGSWMSMFFTSVFSLYIFSHLCNAFYMIGGDALSPYIITAYMGIQNQTFMKVAACGTWMGDFVTAWMVTDMMLQDKLYPDWAKRLRALWKRNYVRIPLFWSVWILMTAIVVTVISTDYVSWDYINRGILPSNELSRAYLASFILVMDLLIVMQDWDFPNFISSMDIKLPGLNTASIKVTIPRCLRRDEWVVHITGKWFNYGIIFMVMLLDLNMWKNQIFYYPFDYGQYTDPGGRIYSVLDASLLPSLNQSVLSYEYRSITPINNQTNQTLMSQDLVMFSKYLDFSFAAKATAFIPSLAAFASFGLLVWWFGRFKVDEMHPWKGRLFRKWNKEKVSSIKEKGKSTHRDNRSSTKDEPDNNALRVKSQQQGHSSEPDSKNGEVQKKTPDTETSQVSSTPIPNVVEKESIL